MTQRALAVTVLLAASAAHAQFANKSLGASLAYTKFNTDAGYDWGLPLSLEASLYIDNGFEALVRVPLMLLTDRTGQQSIGTGGTVGIRYLFSEEQFRPYAGLELSFLHFFAEIRSVSGAASSDLVGLGPIGGLDFFIGDSVTIGARAFFHGYFILNVGLFSDVGGGVVAATFF